MGTNLRELIFSKEIEIKELKGKILAVDSFNVLYQFLSTIRQRDGTPLKDSRGNVTSHLTGMFNRTTKLMKEGVKLIYVFDGEPPLLKQKERERRYAVKEEAMKEYELAKEKGDISEMKKYASRTSKLTGEMIDETKELIWALGLPVVQAPSEGEAQVACIVNNGDAFAGVSEDYDSLLYGIQRLIKNLTISGKRKFGATYVSVKPTMINFSENMNNLGIDRDQLIALAMLVGTDYNQGGIKGIGPKTAIKLVKQHKGDFDKMFKEAKWGDNFDFPWTDVFYSIKKMPVTDKYNVNFGRLNKEKIFSLLVDKHDFSEERVNSALEGFSKQEEIKKQKSLVDF